MEGLQLAVGFSLVFFITAGENAGREGQMGLLLLDVRCFDGVADGVGSVVWMKDVIEPKFDSWRNKLA